MQENFQLRFSTFGWKLNVAFDLNVFLLSRKVFTRFHPYAFACAGKLFPDMPAKGSCLMLLHVQFPPAVRASGKKEEERKVSPKTTSFLRHSPLLQGLHQGSNFVPESIMSVFGGGGGGHEGRKLNINNLPKTYF